MSDLVIVIVSILLATAGFLWRKATVSRMKSCEEPSKSLKRAKKLSTYLIVLGGFVFTTRLIEMLFGRPEAEAINVEIAVQRVDFFGLDVSETVITSWGIMLVVIVIALILRIALVPRLKDVPTGIQNVLEVAIDTITNYTKSTAHGVGEFLASYIFTITVFLIGCACTELFGLRTPSSDITLTGALAILTFLFINFYGIKNKGLVGRIKSLASPTPVVFPIRIVTDLAIPVSLACRLFGNMLGGLVVMELLYTALGSYAIGIPSVAGLYFNVFHPLIQAFIFVTLTLTFINEATE